MSAKERKMMERIDRRLAILEARLPRDLQGEWKKEYNALKWLKDSYLALKDKNRSEGR